jgi:hypothetical protein
MSKWIIDIIDWIRDFINAKPRKTPGSATVRVAASPSDTVPRSDTATVSDVTRIPTLTVQPDQAYTQQTLPPFTAP